MESLISHEMLKVKPSQCTEQHKVQVSQNGHSEAKSETAFGEKRLESEAALNSIKNVTLSALDRTISLMAVLEPDSTLAVKQNKADVIQSHLSFLYKDQKLCDLIIKNDEKQFPIHSFVLTMHSEKYKMIFTDSAMPTPTEISMSSVSSTIIDKVLEYMYTFNIVLTDECISGVLGAAKQLDMKMLLEKCVEYLLKFDANNVLKFLIVAKKHNFKGLAAQYVEFAVENFHQICKLPEFNDLSVDDLKAMLVQENEKNSIVDIEKNVEMMKSFIVWALKDVVTRSVQLARLLENIPLDQIPPEALEDIAESEQFLTDIPECLQVLRKAFRFHAISLTRFDQISNCPIATQNRSRIEFKHSIVVIGGLIDKSGCPYEKGSIVLHCCPDDTHELMQWTESNPLPSRRSGHCAATLKNHLYILGGSIHEGDLLLPMPTQTAIRYNTILKQWEKLPSMTIARNEFAVCVTENLIYVFGGETEQFCPTDIVECFCPKTNRWSLVASMPFGRVSHAACLHREHIFVVGGRIGNTILQFVDVYDFRDDCWLPHETFPTKICRGSLVDLDGFMFYLGGLSPQDTLLVSSEKIYRYNDSTAQWKVVAKLALPRHLAAAATSETRIYIIGGFSTSIWSSTAKVSSFNILKHKCDDYNIPDLPYPLMNMAAVMIVL